MARAARRAAADLFRGDSLEFEIEGGLEMLDRADPENLIILSKPSVPPSDWLGFLDDRVPYSSSLSFILCSAPWRAPT